MFEFEANEAVIVEGRKALEAALSTSPEAQRVLRRILRKYVMEARQRIVNSIHFKHDPRNAKQAIRTAVYRKILGVNINIFSSRKAHGFSSYEPRKKLRPGQRGGNRVPRGANTKRMMRYGALDRGMILRWQNEGVDERQAGTRGGKLSGNRGALVAKNFFKPLGDRSLAIMRDKLSEVLEEEMEKILAKGTK